MTPATGTALLLVAVFVLPGFVTLLLRERAYVVRGEDTPFERFLSALFYSAVIVAIVLGTASLAGGEKPELVDLWEGRKPLTTDVAFGVLIALAMPAALTEAGIRWQASARLRPWTLKRLGIDPGHTVQSGWNYAFARRGTAFVWLTLKDERVVGGFYGDDSLTGYSEHTGGHLHRAALGARRRRMVRPTRSGHAWPVGGAREHLFDGDLRRGNDEESHVPANEKEGP